MPNINNSWFSLLFLKHIFLFRRLNNDQLTKTDISLKIFVSYPLRNIRKNVQAGILNIFLYNNAFIRGRFASYFYGLSGNLIFSLTINTSLTLWV